MDKIFSARLDESVIQQIGSLARELNTTKKAIIEESIKHYSKMTGLEKKIDVFERTCGIWQRSENPEESVAQARSAFNQSMQRYSR